MNTAQALWLRGCNQIGMILLVSALDRREECARRLQEGMGESVVMAESLLRATTLLRAEVYTAAVFDAQLAEAEPAEFETTLRYLGTAIPVEVNLGISGASRLVGLVRAAARRRKDEETTAREAAQQSLRCAVNSTLTGLLLDCELALSASGLPPKTMERLTSIHGAAQKLRTQLGTSAAARA